VASSLRKVARALIWHHSPQPDASARSTWPGPVCQMTHQFTFVVLHSHYHILLRGDRGRVYTSYLISCYWLCRTENWTPYHSSSVECEYKERTTLQHGLIGHTTFTLHPNKCSISFMIYSNIFCDQIELWVIFVEYLLLCNIKSLSIRQILVWNLTFETVKRK